jgi:5-(carboxyamino)imidazole ribonucleotide synthase
LAMRPHNSGHFSIDGSETSQFEQHLRAVLDLPLGSTALTAEIVVMQNLLGGSEATDLQGRAAEALRLFPQIKFHDYCKPPRAGRKLGHLTRSGDNLDLILHELERARSIIID